MNWMFMSPRNQLFSTLTGLLRWTKRPRLKMVAGSNDVTDAGANPRALCVPRFTPPDVDRRTAVVAVRGVCGRSGGHEGGVAVRAARPCGAVAAAGVRGDPRGRRVRGDAVSHAVAVLGIGRRVAVPARVIGHLAWTFCAGGTGTADAASVVVAASSAVNAGTSAATSRAETPSESPFVPRVADIRSRRRPPSRVRRPAVHQFMAPPALHCSWRRIDLERGPPPKRGRDPSDDAHSKVNL